MPLGCRLFRPFGNKCWQATSLCDHFLIRGMACWILGLRRGGPTAPSPYNWPLEALRSDLQARSGLQGNPGLSMHGHLGQFLDPLEIHFGRPLIVGSLSDTRGGLLEPLFYSYVMFLFHLVPFPLCSVFDPFQRSRVVVSESSGCWRFSPKSSSCRCIYIAFRSKTVRLPETAYIIK